MWKGFKVLLQLGTRHHFWAGFFIVVGVTLFLAARIDDRSSFASSELHQDVMDRWGIPIVQPSPSLRTVDSGSVFNTLQAVPFEVQRVKVDTVMNYRKRGLIYFSGFDFDFHAHYEVINHKPHDVDGVFVFPIRLNANRALLSNVVFNVNGQPMSLDLTKDGLVWTGRMPSKEKISFDIAFTGRGLDSFTYDLDPALPVNNLSLTVNISGGEEFDYSDGVLPAREVEREGDKMRLAWSYPSLQSGVPLGVVLPSEKAFDQVLSIMAQRAWAPFIFFFAGLVLLSLLRGQPLQGLQATLLSCAYALFFVLTAYLAAYMHFLVAYPISLVVTGGLVHFYLTRLYGKSAGLVSLGLLAGCVVVPTLAVICHGYTGLIYTLEVLVLTLLLMFVSAHARLRPVVEQMMKNMLGEEVRHEA